MKKVITYGTFDLLHVGHINLLRRAKELGDYLIVVLSTDEFNRGKHKEAYHSYENRKIILEAIRYVDMVVPQPNKNKLEAWVKYHFDAMFVGNDWEGTSTWKKFEEQFKPLGVDIVYLPHTDGTSSTLLTEVLQEALSKN